jgi:hypothetical protein
MPTRPNRVIAPRDPTVPDPAMSPPEEIIETFSFLPEHLAPERRAPGISAFMRIRNGADFLEAAIRSHIDHLDEIVAVYNQCTDATPDILKRLAVEYGPKLRVVHYLPEVFPPGSPGHAREPANSPKSFVNMSNLALARTRFSVATKLDDDHLAIPDRLAALVSEIRAARCRLDKTICFSGINLARDPAGQIGVPSRAPLAGTGGHYFLEVKPTTFFLRDRRHEMFRHHDRRVSRGVTYWHLKFLKRGFGFANRDIDNNPRFAKKRERLLNDFSTAPIEALPQLEPKSFRWLRYLPLPERNRMRIERWQQIAAKPPTQDEFDAVLHVAEQPDGK